MSEQEKIVNNFIHLLKTVPSLFSPEDRNELSQLIDDESDDIDRLSTVICYWLEKHNDVDIALESLEVKENDERYFGITQYTIQIPDYQPNKATLKNAIHQTKNGSEFNNKKNNQL